MKRLLLLVNALLLSLSCFSGYLGDTNIPATYDQYKTGIFRYADKIWVPKGGAIKTSVLQEMMTPGDTLTVLRSSYESLVKGQTHHSNDVEYFHQDILYAQVIAGEITYPYFVVSEKSFLHEKHERYANDYIVSSDTMFVSYALLNEKFTSVSGKKLKDLGADEIVVRFRFGVYFSTRRHDLTNEAFISTNASDDVKLYMCQSGEIGVRNEDTPIWSSNGNEVVYALYPSADGNNVTAMDLYSVESPSRYSTLQQSLTWNVWKNGERVATRKITPTENTLRNETYLSSGNKFEYAQLDPSAFLTEGDEYCVTRTISLTGTNFSCTTDSIKFHVVPPLKMDSFPSVTNYVCSKTEDEVELEIVPEGQKTITRWFWHQTKGLPLDEIPYADLYGVKYMWEYRNVRGDNWKELPLKGEGRGGDIEAQYNSPSGFASLYNSSPQDLVVALPLIKENNTYEFRQVVYLTGFGGRKIYAPGKGSVRVTGYRRIKPELFDVSVTGDLCADEKLKEVELKIQFQPDPNEKYSCWSSGSMTNGLKYTYSVPDVRNGEVITSLFDEKFNMVGDAERKKTWSVSVTDVCGNEVEFKQDLVFEKSPSIILQNVVCDNANRLEKNGNLTLEVPDESTIVLQISPEEEDYALCDYYISEDDSIYTKIGSRGAELSLKSEPRKRFYLKKRYKIGGQCESQVVFVDVVKVTAIRDNRISETLFYVCEREKNPTIGCDQVSGGYGADSYSYKWIYSLDDRYYKPMMSNGGDIITDPILSANKWDQSITEPCYIRRVVFSRNEDGGGVSDTSNYAIISPYSKPMMTLTADKTTVCYDSLVTFSMSQDSLSLAQFYLSEKQNHKASPSYSYVIKTMEGEELAGLVDMSEVGNSYRMKITCDTVVYAKLNVCGSNFYSAPVKIESGADLKPKIAYGACRVRGGKVDVQVLNPVAEWIYSIEQNGEEKGSVRAAVDVPEVGSLDYLVRVSNGNCVHVGHPTVADTTLHDSFRHFDLEVNQVRGEVVNLCAGVSASITNNANEGNATATNYEWSVNGIPLENKDKKDLEYTFPLTSTTYKMKRVSKEIRGGNLCQSIVDSVFVRTYDNVSGATLTLDNTGYLCSGDSVKWTLGGATGGMLLSYRYELMCDGKRIGQGVLGVESEKSDYYKFAEAGKHTFTAKVTDYQCDTTNGVMHSQVTAPKSVTQAAEADFKLKASPSLINEDGTGKSTTVIISATAAEETTLDEFSYHYKKTDGTEVTGTSIGGLFSIIVDSTDFTNDLLVLNVTRNVNETGCSANSKVTISQTQGFMQRPSLEASAMKESYCGGEKITFSVPELPRFGDLILSPGDVSYAWLRNGSLVGSADTCTVTVIAGDTLSIMCMISYKYDASLRAAHVYSEEFLLVGKPGIQLGRVTEVSSGERSKNLCLGDITSHFTLKVDAEVGPKDTLVWEHSLNGSEWKPIPETCRVGGDLVNGQSIDLLASAYTSDLNTKYFRLKGISQCGVESYSTNVFSLKIDTLPSIPEIALRGGNLIHEKVNSLTFSPKAHYAGFSYHWGIAENDLNQVSSVNGAQAAVEGEFEVGSNSVYVYKQALSGAQCVSPTLKYDFKLYEELKIGALMPSQLDSVRCPDETSINFNISDVMGGTGEYNIVWQYKTYGDNWISFDEKSENLGFNAEMLEGSFFGTYMFRLIVTGLKATTTFRAIIKCEGDYSGTSKTTNEYTVSYYEPMTAGRVDLSEETLCYGTTMSPIVGELPSGGDGVYTFRWMRSATPDDENSWTMIHNATTQSYAKCDTMFESTFFKRVVTDGCGTRLESKGKLVNVLPKYEIRKEDVNYSKVVRAGNGAKMWGVPRNAADNSIYVWYNSDFQALDTTSVREIYTTSEKLSGGDDTKTYTYYAAKLDAASGCLSYNYDTLYVTAYENVSGTIYVEGTEKETEDNFWVCPNDNQVQVGSKSDPEEAEYRWYYRVTTNANTAEPVVGDWSLLRGTASAPVRGVRLSLDTCDVEELFRNGTGRAKFVELKRVASFLVADQVTSVESNVIKINVVPTMKSVSYLYDLTGELTTDRNTYCKGDKAVAVSGALDNDTEAMAVWRNVSRYFGPWLYDKDYNKNLGFSTWYEHRFVDGEWDTVSMKNFNENGYAAEFMPGEGGDHVMNRTWQVRRAVSDGCTSVYTDVLPLYVIDEAGKLGNIEMFAYGEDGRSRIRKGFEIGDSLHVAYLSTEAYDCLWSLDRAFVDTLEAQMNYFSFRVTGRVANKLMADPYIYMKRKSEGCWSSVLSIPISLGSASDGGMIGYDQTICSGGVFDAIRSVSEPRGEWKTPVDAPMKWSYSWQFSIDSVTWANISGADSLLLKGADVTRFASLLDSKVTYFRRVATNDSLRTRYSNVVKMTYYDALKPGTLSLNTDKNGFCVYDELPTVLSTAATGGRISEDGLFYTWYMRMNQGDYYEYKGYRGGKFNLNFEDSLIGVDRSANVVVDVKCRYEDVCGSVESEPLTLTLFRENKIPKIYQDNDSCDAEEMTIKVIEDMYDKSYYFVAMLNSESSIDSVIWSSETKTRTIRRNTSMLVDEYAVYSVDETGCVSGYNYFNIDSLPKLSQESLAAPEVVCYGEPFTVVGTPAIGGNGTKHYGWQYSYDGYRWDGVLGQTEESLTVTNPMVSTYYRRIVTDMCGVDTSSILFVKVKEAVKMKPEWIELRDYRCEGLPFTVLLSEEAPSRGGMDSYSMWVNGQEKPFKSWGVTMDGFVGDSLLLQFSYAVTDSAAKRCESERINLYAHNAVKIDHARNLLSCDNLTPCNGMVVEIVGEQQRGDIAADKIRNKWYVMKPGTSWTEQLLQTENVLKLRVEDTMYVRRLLDNGCVYDTSNIVTIIGSKVVDYDYLSALSLNVVSDAVDDSVTLNMVGAKNFGENYYFVGDGTMPVVESNSVRLPYTAQTYKDSLLQLIAVSDICVSQYEFKPLRGGVISFDGASMLCGGTEIPAIVATDVEGGHHSYTYQWQYMNQYTGEFVNIEGADKYRYTPAAVSVPTDYRRLTFSGEYTSISNVITIHIRPLPKARNIYTSVSDSLLDTMGLKSTQYSVERLPSLQIVLLDSITDVDYVTWQRSYDAVTWENLESVEADDSNIYRYETDDTTSIVYYRTVGYSSCGTDTSKVYKVTTLYASFISDDELVLIDKVCKGEKFMRIAYKTDYLDVYEYSYRTISGPVKWFLPLNSSVPLEALDTMRYADRFITEGVKTPSGVVVDYPSESFDVEITRYVKRTGASSTKIVHFFVNDLKASFSYIVDGVESHQSGEPAKTVRINQGSKVTFKSETKSEYPDAELSYKWQLIRPLNSHYYNTFGGSVGRDGLTSELDSPSCYFYNAGSYPIKFEVSDGMCSSTVIDTAIYIDQATVRHYSVDGAFELESFDPEQIIHEYNLSVYPNPCQDVLHVKTEPEAEIRLFDLIGTKLYEGKGSQGTIDMRPFVSGSYLLDVNGEKIKILKR